jgi:hypothetical protein
MSSIISNGDILPEKLILFFNFRILPFFEKITLLCVKIEKSKIFKYFMIIILLINSICLSFYSDIEIINPIFYTLEIFFLIFYFIQSSIKQITYGLFKEEIGYLNNQTEIIEGPCGFTGLYEDNGNHRIFLTTEIGIILVFLTQSFPPLLVNNIQLSSEAPIQSLDISLLKSYIFAACSDGQIIVLDINKPGKEKLIKEISNFGGNMKLTVVKYYREQNELITGDENGRIIIWNLKIGKSIFSWNAHEGPITHMVFLPQVKLIISSGKDKYFRTWRLPEKWQNEDFLKFEQTEIKNISDTMAMLKLQKNLSKPEDYNSDEDSLNGWDYNDEFDP